MAQSQDKIELLKLQLEGFMSKLDHMDPGATSVEDIDHLLKILEEMEERIK